jgi:hypothetical protein
MNKIIEVAAVALLGFAIGAFLGLIDLARQIAF